LCGGSYTEGSLDNIYRYNISKMSYAHFVETKYHKDNLIKNDIKKNIFVIGSPGIEDVNKNLLKKSKLTYYYFVF
jgi:UDP-N-acetylglucosamine 2-epimerase